MYRQEHDGCCTHKKIANNTDNSDNDNESVGKIVNEVEVYP